MRKHLAQLCDGEAGTVVEIEGGHGLRSRLVGLGIREGARLHVVCAPRGRGPTVVTVGHGRVAIGHGMAQKIVMEIQTP